MTAELGADVEDVIRQVKEAVAAVQAAQEQRAAGMAAVEVARIELTIRTVGQRSAGGDVTFRVPLTGQELGAGGGVSREEVQSVELVLVPPAAVSKGLRKWDVAAELASAILAIEEGLTRSAQAEPRFDLEAAAVELHLTVGRNGRLSIVGRGAAAREATQTVKLHLRPAPGRGG